jgi:hypothetical protein
VALVGRHPTSAVTPGCDGDQHEQQDGQDIEQSSPAARVGQPSEVTEHAQDERRM